MRKKFVRCCFCRADIDVKKSEVVPPVPYTVHPMSKDQNGHAVKAVVPAQCRCTDRVKCTGQLRRYEEDQERQRLARQYGIGI